MKTQLGHYDIVAELGRGGMGVVYKGYEPSLNRYVAIKVLAESLAHDESVKERFLREARSMAALNDPHIIQIYFIGEDAGQTFFVMEFVEGESLGSMLKHEGKLKPDQSARVIYQTAQGLATAHDKGVIHRDIKPGNLMLTSRGQVKIADFGIALVTQDFSKKLTSTGEFVGTPGYLSPEVCLGKPVDQRSDIFSLGIVLFEMLTGRMPFTDESPLGLMLEVVKAEIPDVRQLNEEVDPELSRILTRMIAKEPGDRYQSCQELVADLARHPALATGQTLTIKPRLSTAAATIIGAKTPVSGQRPLPQTTPTPRPGPIPNVTPPPAPAAAAPAAVAAADPKTVPSGRHRSVLEREDTQPKRKGSALPWAIAAALLLAAGGGAYAFRAQIPVLQQWFGTPTTSTTTASTLPTSLTASTASTTTTPTTPAAATTAPATPTPPAATTAVAAADPASTATTPASSTVSGTTSVPAQASTGAVAAADPAGGNSASFASADAPQNTTAAMTPATPTPPAQASVAVGATDERVAGNDGGHPLVGSTDNGQGGPAPRASRVEALRDLAAARASENGGPQPRIARVTEPERTTAPPKPHVPTIAVLAGGDDVISEPAQQQVAAMLSRRGFNVIDESVMPRVAHLLGGARPDFGAAIAAIARSGRVDAVVFINAKPVGTQQLNYYGQSSTLYTVQLGVRAYNVNEKRMLGPGWSENVNFTSLNALEKAKEAIEPMLEDVENSIDDYRARRGRG